MYYEPDLKIDYIQLGELIDNALGICDVMK